VPVLHNGHLVAHDEGLVLIVGDDDRGRPERSQQGPDLGLQLDAQLHVQRLEGLVQQQHPRARRQRPRDGDSLLLAARQGVGHALLEAGEVDHLQHLAHPRAAVGSAAEPVGHVPTHREVWEQRALLAEQADAPGFRRHVHARTRQQALTHVHLPAVGDVEARHDAHERRLAATAGTQQGEGSPALDAQIDAVQDLRLAEGLVHLDDPQIPETVAVGGAGLHPRTPAGGLAVASVAEAPTPDRRLRARHDIGRLGGIRHA